MDFRIGIGYDIHRLVEGRKLFVGGIEIPYIKGLLGHSDGDVLLHAICDALLGAIGCSDIGEHFPDKEPQYQNIPSTELLKRVYTIVKEKGFLINNLDTVIIASQPLLNPFKKQIQQNLSRILETGQDRINIKAKTGNETDHKETMASFASVLLSEGQKR